jgi:hypothetical protein
MPTARDVQADGYKDDHHNNENKCPMDAFHCSIMTTFP